jgi:hypothetical protein
MQYIWTKEDIICGRIVCKPWKSNKPIDGWSAKWTFKLGFYGGDNKCCLIAMTDGMISMRDRSMAEIAEFLTENGMMPMPHKRFIATMDYLRDCYES